MRRGIFIIEWAARMRAGGMGHLVGLAAGYRVQPGSAASASGLAPR